MEFTLPWRTTWQIANSLFSQIDTSLSKDWCIVNLKSTNTTIHPVFIRLQYNHLPPIILHTTVSLTWNTAISVLKHLDIKSYFALTNHLVFLNRYFFQQKFPMYFVKILIFFAILKLSTLFRKKLYHKHSGQNVRKAANWH